MQERKILKKAIIISNIIAILALISIAVITLIQMFRANDVITDLYTRYLFIIAGLLLLVSLNTTDLTKRFFIIVRGVFISFGIIGIILSVIKFVTMQLNDKYSLWLNTILTEDVLFWLSSIALICVILTIIYELFRISGGNKNLPEIDDEISENEEEEIHVLSEEQENEAAEENEKLD
jgi:hypothetical protein